MVSWDNESEGEIAFPVDHLYVCLLISAAVVLADLVELGGCCQCFE